MGANVTAPQMRSRPVRRLPAPRAASSARPPPRSIVAPVHSSEKAVTELAPVHLWLPFSECSLLSIAALCHILKNSARRRTDGRDTLGISNADKAVEYTRQAAPRMGAQLLSSDIPCRSPWRTKLDDIGAV